MPEHQHTNKRKNELKKRQEEAKKKSVEDFFARRYYHEEENRTLLSFMRGRRKRLIEQGQFDPEYQEWLRKHKEQKHKKFLDDLKKRLKKARLTKITKINLNTRKRPFFYEKLRVDNVKQKGYHIDSLS